MKDYTKLVEALRCCAVVHTKPTKCPDYDDSWCSGNCLDNHLIAAADAIEALQAAEPTEKQVVDYCHKRCLVVLEADLFHELKASYGKMPKRGEWVDGDNFEDPFLGKFRCSVCGHAVQAIEYNYEQKTVRFASGKTKYCPNCGAKMEVQDGK